MPGVSKKQDINGRKYEVHRLPFGAMRKLEADIARYLGMSIQELAGNLNDMPIVDLVSIIVGLGQELDSQKFDDIFDPVYEQTFVGEKREPLSHTFAELWFSEHAEDFFPWARLAIEVNLLAFLGGIKAILPKELSGLVGSSLMSKRISSLSQKGSTGTSGD